MKSSIKIESFGISNGHHPVLRVKVSDDTSDLRDWTMKSFFETLGCHSNVLFVKFIGGGVNSETGAYSNLEIFPVKDLILSYMPDTKECGICIGDNKKELRDFLDNHPRTGSFRTNYTNDGTAITLFNPQDIWDFATQYGKYLRSLDEAKYNYVQNNSIAFVHWLGSQGIECFSSGHSTGIPKDVDLFDLGVKWEKYRDLNEPKRQN